MSGLRRASKIIAVVWALALAAAIPYAVFSSIHYVHHPTTNEVSTVTFHIQKKITQKGFSSVLPLGLYYPPRYAREAKF